MSTLDDLKLRAGEKFRRLIFTADGSFVCKVDTHGEFALDHEEAIARMFVAAPELVATLRAIFADCADINTDSRLTSEVGKRLRAALLLATGSDR